MSESESTPAKVCVQLWVTPEQREKIRRQAQARRSNMTAYLLELAEADGERPLLPPPRPQKIIRRFRPEPLLVEDQLGAFLRAIEAIPTGGALEWPRWHHLHRLFWGLDEADRRAHWHGLTRWQKHGKIPLGHSELVIRAFDRFARLRQQARDVWVANTGYRKPDPTNAERQRRYRKRVADDRHAVWARFESEHVTGPEELDS